MAPAPSLPQAPVPRTAMIEHGCARFINLMQLYGWELDPAGETRICSFLEQDDLEVRPLASQKLRVHAKKYIRSIRFFEDTVLH